LRAHPRAHFIDHGEHVRWQLGDAIERLVVGKGHVNHCSERWAVSWLPSYATPGGSGHENRTSPSTPVMQLRLLPPTPRPEAPNPRPHQHCHADDAAVAGPAGLIEVGFVGDRDSL